jgi:hypothetical protein
MAGPDRVVLAVLGPGVPGYGLYAWLRHVPPGLGAVRATIVASPNIALNGRRSWCRSGGGG